MRLRRRKEETRRDRIYGEKDGGETREERRKMPGQGPSAPVLCSEELERSR
jgi:hypothetical protein